MNEDSAIHLCRGGYEQVDERDTANDLPRESIGGCRRRAINGYNIVKEQAILIQDMLNGTIFRPQIVHPS